MILPAGRPTVAVLLTLCIVGSAPTTAQSITLGDVLRAYGAAAGPIVASADDGALSKPITLPQALPEAPSREELACALRLNGCRVAVLTWGLAVLPSGEPGEGHPTWKQIDEIAAVEETLMALRAMAPEAAAAVLLGAWFRLAECPPDAQRHLRAAMNLRVAPEDEARLARRTAARLNIGAIFRLAPTYLAPREPQPYMPTSYQVRGLAALSVPGGLTCYVQDHEGALRSALECSALSWRRFEPDATPSRSDPAPPGPEFAAADWDERKPEIDGQPAALGTLIAACTAPTAAVECDPRLRDMPVLAVIGDADPATVLRAALIACEADAGQEDERVRIAPASEAGAGRGLVAQMHDRARARYLVEVLLPALELRGRAGATQGTEFMREIIALGPPYGVPRERVPELLDSGAPLDRMIGYFQQDPPDLDKWRRDALTSGSFEARLALSSTWASGHVVALVDADSPAGDQTRATRYMVLEVQHASVGWNPQR